MSEPFSTFASLKLDQLLDNIGYSEQYIQERRQHMDKSSIARSLSAQKIQKRDDIERIFVGSQREGIGLKFVSDLDVLHIYDFVQCLENIDAKDENKIGFLIENQSCSPGHYLLQLVHEGLNNENFQLLEHAIIERYGKKYLSSDLFMDKNDDMFATAKGYIGQNTVYLDRKGPSIPKFVTQSSIENILFKMISMPSDANHTMDYVRGFPCSAHNLLKSWRNRKRDHDWPQSEMIELVPTLPCFLVPVGQKETKNRDLQWRVCFTLGELTLLRSFNNTHTKTYMVLKQIGKQILKPINQQITSFVLKNIVLWEAERRPMDQFKPEYLCSRIKDALLSLKSCIKENILPYYMLPERNLLPIRFSKEDQENLIANIDMLLDKGEEKMTETLEQLAEERAPENITNLIRKLIFGHVCTRIEICKCSVFTIKQLSHYYEWMFFENYFAFQFLYNFFANSIPFFWKYGNSLFNDPLNVEIKQTEDDSHDTGKFVSNFHLMYKNSTPPNATDIDNQEPSQEKTPTIVRSQSSDDSGIEIDMDNPNDEILMENIEEDTQNSTTKQQEGQTQDRSSCPENQRQRMILWTPKRKKKVKAKDQRRTRRAPKDSTNETAAFRHNIGISSELLNQEISVNIVLDDILLPLLSILLLVYGFHSRYTDIFIILSNPTTYLMRFVILVMCLCSFVIDIFNTICKHWYREPIPETTGSSNKHQQTLALRHTRKQRKGRHH